MFSLIFLHSNWQFCLHLQVVYSYDIISCRDPLPVLYGYMSNTIYELHSYGLLYVITRLNLLYIHQWRRKSRKFRGIFINVPPNKACPNTLYIAHKVVFIISHKTILYKVLDKWATLNRWISSTEMTSVETKQWTPYLWYKFYLIFKLTKRHDYD